MEFRPRPRSIILAVMLVSVIGWFSLKSTLPGLPHGDEVHYMLMTISMLQDHDLNLKNNYSARDYNQFVPGSVAPHWAYYRDGRMYSSHEPGLPVLMLLPYRLWGRTGCVFFMGLLGFLAAFQAYFLALKFQIKPSIAALTTFSMATTLPFLMMSGKIFPEIPAALFLITGFNLLVMDDRLSHRFTGCLMLAILPWLHLKFSVLSLLVFLAFLLLRRPSLRHLLIISLPAIVFGVVLIIFQITLFGDPFYLVRIKGGAFQGPFPGVFGLLLDREVGLLVFAPVMSISILSLYRHRLSAMKAMAIIFVVFWIVSGAWIDWHSGHCPPARYLIPLLPFLGVFLVWEMNQSNKSSRWWLFSFLWSLSLVQVIGILVTIPEYAIVHYDGVNRLWSHYLPWNLNFSAPSFLNSSGGTIFSFTGALLLLSCVGILTFRDRTRGKGCFWIAGGVFLLSIGMLLWGVHIETQEKILLAKTPLPNYGPVIVEPEPDRVFFNELPDLIWEPVPGADGYLWMILFPDGSVVKVPKFGTTHQKLPDSIAEAILPGKYCWWVIPTKAGKRGVASKKVCFQLVKN
ncbi:hypothetical protein K8T06_13335 [bacterium]|nr:hypothetical protein [bacterium]